jgi:hypothetical protein
VEIHFIDRLVLVAGGWCWLLLLKSRRIFRVAA